MIWQNVNLKDAQDNRDIILVNIDTHLREIVTILSPYCRYSDRAVHETRDLSFGEDKALRTQGVKVKTRDSWNFKIA